jgi:hypothetical protein
MPMPDLGQYVLKDERCRLLLDVINAFIAIGCDQHIHCFWMLSTHSLWSCLSQWWASGLVNMWLMKCECNVWVCIGCCEIVLELRVFNDNGGDSVLFQYPLLRSAWMPWFWSLKIFWQRWTGLHVSGRSGPFSWEPHRKWHVATSVKNMFSLYNKTTIHVNLHMAVMSWS